MWPEEGSVANSKASPPSAAKKSFKCLLLLDISSLHLSQVTCIIQTDYLDKEDLQPRKEYLRCLESCIEKPSLCSCIIVVCDVDVAEVISNHFTHVITDTL